MRPLRFPFTALLWPPLFLLTLFCAGMAIAAQGGRTSPALDVLTHLSPIWLAACAVMFGAALLFRGGLRWGLAFPAVVGMAAAVALMAPEFVRSTGPHAPPDAPGQIKIVQLNAWRDNPAPEAIFTWLAKERPDIVVIEENSPQLRAALARHPEWHVGCVGCEVVMLSRAPAVFVGLPPWRSSARIGAPITRGYFRDSHGVFPVIGAHNAWPTDFADQQFQERRLAAYIAETGRERLIVTGDFNSTPWSFSRRRWDQAFRLTRRERALFSWPASLADLTGRDLPSLPLLPIDHVYAGPAWATVSVRRGPRVSSDHYPVVVTLAPVGPAPAAPR